MQGIIFKIRTLLLYLAVFSFPWFFLPITQEYFLTNKFYLLVVISLISLMLLALDQLIVKKMHLIKTPFERIFVLFIGAQLVSLLFSSPNKIQALTSLPWGFFPTLAIVMLYFLLVNALSHKKNASLLITNMLAGTIISGLVIIVIWFNPLTNMNLPVWLEFLKNPTFSPAGNSIDSAMLMGFLFFIGLAAAAQKIFGVQKKLPVLPIIGLLVGTIATALIGYSIFFAQKNQQQVQLPPFSTSWYTAVEGLKTVQTAVVGAGLDNYISAFTSAKPQAYNLTPHWSINYNISRSMLLHVWTETGLLGLISILLLFIYIIREVQGLFAEKDTNRYVYAIWAIYTGTLTILMPPSYILFFLIIVLCAALAITSQKYNPEEAQLDLTRMPFMYIGISLVLLCLVGIVGYFGARAYASEFFFKQSIDSFRKNDGKAVYNNLIQAIKLHPYIERNHTQFSQVNLLLANNVARKKELNDTDREDIARFVQLAISESKASIQLNPQKVEYWNNLALVYRNVINVAQGAESWAVASYRRAMLLDPNNPAIRLNLGGVYYALNDYPQAVNLFEQSVALKPNWANAFYNLAWAHFQNKTYDKAIININAVLSLLDKNSADYKKAQENLAAFKEASENIKKNAAQEASESAKIQQGDQLNLPAAPQPQLSPQLQLPEGAGPDITITPSPMAPSPTVTP